MKSKNPIVQKFLDGEMDAGGTIHALEDRVTNLENLLNDFLSDPSIELDGWVLEKIEETLKVRQ